MTQTQAILELHLPPVLADLAHEYLKPSWLDDYEIALSGHGELCYSIIDYEIGLRCACIGKYPELVVFMIERGATCKNTGLEAACRSGDIDTIATVIKCGANGWNWGLWGACKGGHLVVVGMMISLGANNWDLGLSGACEGGHVDLIAIMIGRGATKCRYCTWSMEEHLRLAYSDQKKDQD